MRLHGNLLVAKMRGDANHIIKVHKHPVHKAMTKNSGTSPLSIRTFASHYIRQSYSGARHFTTFGGL